MNRQQNNPNFRVNVCVYHPETDALISFYWIDQCVAPKKRSFNIVTRAVHDCIEAAQSTDGLRYVAYFPVWESWVKGGNRLFESTVG